MTLHERLKSGSEAVWRFRWWLPAIAAISLLLTHCFAWNSSPSMPNNLVFIASWAQPQVGDAIAYRFEGQGIEGSRYGKGSRFYKRIVAKHPAVISIIGENVYVENQLIGRAKLTSTAGVALHTISPGAIPSGYFFVAGDRREDSFDSRYEESGLVRKESILGVAYGIL